MYSQVAPSKEFQFLAKEAMTLGRNYSNFKEDLKKPKISIYQDHALKHLHKNEVKLRNSNRTSVQQPTFH